jgi:hypothetical protein
MSNQIPVDQNEDHIGGNFTWEIEPKCSCGKIKEAVDDQFLFVSNFTDEGFNQFYMLPVAADGTLFRSDGLPISHCPWCGDKIKGRKKYPSK